MFPLGTAGAALLILRISVAATLIFDGTAHWTLLTSFWIVLAFAILTVLLCIGLLTPCCSALSSLILLVVWIANRGQDDFHFVIAILNGGILSLLGPGAYSVDARIFGRRLLTLPPRQ
jgi:uncharacterized membrane protein YphA (DoxX/SURF4 family)